MLLRVYRITDRTGIVVLKTSTALSDWLLSGTQTTVGTFGKVIGGILSVVMIAVVLLASGIGAVLKLLGRALLLAFGGVVAIAGVGVKGAQSAVGNPKTAPAGGTATGGAAPTRSKGGARGGTMARQTVYDEPDVTIIEDPLKRENRRLSFLVVLLGVIVIGVVFWATDPTRSNNRVAPANVGDNAAQNFQLNATPVPTSIAAITLPTPIPTAVPQPAALRAGGSLAYVVRERGQDDIWVVNVGSRTPLRILNSVEDDRDPAWSPDGSRLAYASREDGNWEIYVYDLRQSADPNVATTRITFDLSFQANPAWSTDGLWLAYESYQGNNLDIYAVPVDGSEAPVRITDHETPDFAPVWSPDGRRIAFVSWRDGNQDIYIFNLDTLETINFTATPNRNEDHPAWSSDGDNIAFSAVDAGREKVLVQSVKTPGAVAQALGIGRTPSWSPDGTTLTYAVDANDQSQTYLYAVPLGVAGAISTEIVAVPYGASSPVWSNQVLPPALINAGGVDLAVRDDLYIEQFVESDSGAPYNLSLLPEVQVANSQPYLSDRVNDSFNALRERVQQRTGLDVLGTLDNAWWDLNRRPELGEPRRNWHMTGRAFSLTRSSILGFPAPFEIVREDTETETYWHVYIRVAAETQNGQLGEPLRRLPWDFLSRSSGDVEAYNQGGRLRGAIPSGYYIDFTQLALDYGWQPFPAGSDWRANTNTINYWMFWKPEGLEWYNAMREIHTEGALVNFAPTPIPGQ